MDFGKKIRSDEAKERGVGWGEKERDTGIEKRQIKVVR